MEFNMYANNIYLSLNTRKPGTSNKDYHTKYHHMPHVNSHYMGGVRAGLQNQSDAMMRI